MNFSGLLIEDSGKNNIINIEVGAEFKRSKIIIKGDNCIITIGKALIYTNLIINLKGNNKTLEIKPSNKNIHGLKWVSIRGDNQKLSIGKNLSCGGLEIQMNDGDENCSIGDDCLLSWGIKIRTSDGHSVVDLVTDRAINLPQDVKIGNRVWIGESVSFLKGSQISEDSVVGSHAIVTRKFDQKNCIIAGFPAMIVKENIKWDRRMPKDYNKMKGGGV
jgi:acetyltransferase-like isoleucine patch superfamily enzyme